MLQTNDRTQIQRAVDAITDRLAQAEDRWWNVAVGRDDVFDQEVAEGALREAWLLIVDLLHTLNMPSVFDFAKRKHKSFEADPLASRMGVDDPFLVHADEARSIVRMVRDVHLPTSRHDVAVASVDALLDILRRCETYILSRNAFGFVPAREEDVHQRIQGLLECSFPDVEPRPPLPSMGGIKSFIPDTGIRSLRTVIDYKFIEDRGEGKNVLDEIFADISGYQSDAYDTFVFVIYETTRAFSEEKWITAIERAKPGTRVAVIVLKGTPPAEADKQASDALKGSRAKVAKRHAKRMRRDADDAGKVSPSSKVGKKAKTPAASRMRSVLNK